MSSAPRIQQVPGGALRDPPRLNDAVAIREWEQVVTYPERLNFERADGKEAR